MTLNLFGIIKIDLKFVHFVFVLSSLCCFQKAYAITNDGANEVVACKESYERAEEKYRVAKQELEAKRTEYKYAETQCKAQTENIDRIREEIKNMTTIATALGALNVDMVSLSSEVETDFFVRLSKLIVEQQIESDKNLSLKAATAVNRLSQNVVSQLLKILSSTKNPNSIIAIKFALETSAERLSEVASMMESTLAEANDQKNSLAKEFNTILETRVKPAEAQRDSSYNSYVIVHNGANPNCRD